MQKTTGDNGAMVAAMLTQAESTLRASAMGQGTSSSIVARMTNYGSVVQEAYARHLAFVTGVDEPELE